MKDKIGLAIVTYGGNYGTYLQAYATQCIVEKLGYQPEVINLKSVIKEVSKARRKYFISRLLNFRELASYSVRANGILVSEINKKYREYIENRVKCFHLFCERNFHFSDIVPSWSGLSDLCNSYKAVIVGSDQLWRPANIAGGFYTLEFVPENVNKIAYATSFGLASIRKNQEEKAKRFLTRINHISVREKSGQSIISELIGRKVPVVCDPTMLLNKEEWRMLAEKKPLISGNYILVYFLGKNPIHRYFVKRLKEKIGCRIVGIIHIEGYIKIDEELSDDLPRDVGPFEFLNLIEYATYVCTDSFHGCVFSILFNKTFFSFRRFNDNNPMSTNDRIITLLNNTKLSNRLVVGEEQIDDNILLGIDFSEVNTVIQQFRAEAQQYLKNALAEKNTDI